MVCVCFFFQAGDLIFFPSVVLTCLCTCHVTNRTFGFICNCWVFSYKHQYKTSWPWRPTFQRHASVSSTQNSSRLFTNWHWIILVGSYRSWWTHDKVSISIHRHVRKRLSTNVSSSEYRHKIKVHFCCKEDKSHLEDTEVGILWKTWWWLTVRILQLYCLFSDFNFLFMLICKYSFLQPHFLDTTVIALQKPLQCNHST